MVYPLEGDQFAALLQSLNHPVFRPFLATAVTSIVSVIVYEKGLPTTENIMKINNVLARIAASSSILCEHRPRDNITNAIIPSPNHPVLQMFGLEPELFCTANYTNNEKSTLYSSPATGISDKNGAFVAIFMGLASVVGLVSVYINRQNSRNFEARNLSDAQFIAYIMQQLNRVSEAWEDIEAALQLAEEEAYVAKSDLRTSTHEKSQLEKRVKELTSQCEKAFQAANTLDDALKVARDTIEENASMVASTAKRLETQNERMKELESDKVQLQKLVDEERESFTVIQTEIDRVEGEAETQLEAIYQENYELTLQLQAAKSKIEELAQQNAELDKSLRNPGVRDTMMREFFEKTENKICALEVQVRDLTLQNNSSTEELRHNGINNPIGNMSSSIEAPASTNGTRIASRKLRRAIFTNYQAKAAVLDYSDDSKVYELQLPCHDPSYHDGQLPLPAQVPLEDTVVNGAPVETLKINVDGKEMPLEKCRSCREWYSKKDRNDHQLVCRDFFATAVFCTHCEKIFRNNGGFLHEHLPRCERQARGGLV